jgi:hypothetical protein
VDGATAQVVIHTLDNLGFRCPRFLKEQAVDIQDHAGGAEAALEGIVFDEGFLNGMKSSTDGEPFDGQYVLPPNLRDRDLARPDRFLIDENGAGPAEAFAAAVLGSGETQISAKDPEKLPFSVDLQACRLPIELELDHLDHLRQPPLWSRFTDQS